MPALVFSGRLVAERGVASVVVVEREVVEECSPGLGVRGYWWSDHVRTAAMAVATSSTLSWPKLADALLLVGVATAAEVEQWGNVGTM